MRFGIVAVSVCLCGTAWAQEDSQAQHQATASPPNGRYEILQSALAARWTFRLDRYSGQVYQLVTTSDGDFTWEEMRVIDRLPVATARPRFQLFSSGIAAKFTFMMDAESGMTWQVTASKSRDANGRTSEVTVWVPLR